MPRAKPKTSHLSNSVAGDVINTAVAVKNAGDGLSKALAAAPMDLQSGDRGFIALEYEVGDIHFVRVKDAPGCFTRKADLIAETVTFIDDEAVEAAIERQKVALEEHQGVHRLPLGEDGEEPEGDT